MLFGYMKCYGFHGNPLCDFKEWGYLIPGHSSFI